MISLQDILEVENDSALLDVKCPQTGLLLWPMVRQEVIQWVISAQVYKTASLVNLSPRVKSRTKAMSALLKAEWHNLTFHSKVSPILLMATGAGLITKDGQLFNRLSDYFAFKHHTNTLVIEDLFNWNWPKNRANNKVMYHTPAQVKMSIHSNLKVTHKHLFLAKQLLDTFTFNLKHKLDITLPENIYQLVQRRLSKKIAILPVRKQFYQKLFGRLQPTLLLKEEACYGHSGVINYTAREMGIYVAEYQHGAINAGHDAYNHAAKLVTDRHYQALLPNALLSYGEWWHQYINLPVEKTVIGNPHRSERVAEASSGKVDKNEILVLGDGIETGMYIELAHFLSKNLPAFKVVFRPHPLERQKLAEILSSTKLDKLTIDSRLDIYDSFRNAHVVINEVSTGLFEAVGLVDRILIWDTPKSRFYFPHHPFESFTDKESLLSKIRQPDQGLVTPAQAEKIWASGWQENYQHFVRKHLMNV
jgi:hypothetical protein